MFLAAILRIRNESLIIEETIDHLGKFCDGIYILDDASTDNTVEICKKYNTVIDVLEEPVRSLYKFGQQYQGKQRQRLLRRAQLDNPRWIMCVDADERSCPCHDGKLFDYRSYLSSIPSDVDGIAHRFIEFYMTPFDKDKKYEGSHLSLRKWCGPEYWDHPFIVRNKKNLTVNIRIINGRRKTIYPEIYWLHYGKAISIERWEEKCNYYSKYFPKCFRIKWNARRGKAINYEMKSDFRRDLITINQVIKRDFNPVLYKRFG